MRMSNQVFVAFLLLAGILFLVGPGGTAMAQQDPAGLLFKKAHLIVGGISTGRTFSPDPCPPVGCISTAVSYFTHIEGIDCPLFAGEPKNETTARFTGFDQQVNKYWITNGQLAHGIHEISGESYFNPTPTGRSWNDPDSFKTGQKIATD